MTSGRSFGACYCAHVSARAACDACKCMSCAHCGCMHAYGWAAVWIDRWVRTCSVGGMCVRAWMRGGHVRTYLGTSRHIAPAEPAHDSRSTYRPAAPRYH